LTTEFPIWRDVYRDARRGFYSIVNSTFADNVSNGVLGGGVFLISPSRALVENSIFSGNVRSGPGGCRSLAPTVSTEGDYNEVAQLALIDQENGTGFLRVGPGMTIRSSAFGGITGDPCPLEAFRAGGNVNAEPGETFKGVDPINPDLTAGAPVIDRGNDFVDFDPTLPGFQLLPETDVSGAPRTVDGDGDGVPVVDMGAFEFQGN
jgi:hypothetical protein